MKHDTFGCRRCVRVLRHPAPFWAPPACPCCGRDMFHLNERVPKKKDLATWLRVQWLSRRERLTRPVKSPHHTSSLEA